MLNIKELEKKWLKYKIKSLIPYLIIFVSIPLIVVSIVIIFDNINNKKVKHTKKIIVHKNITKVKKKPLIVKKEPIKIEQKKLQVIKLKPSLGFMKRIQNSAQPYYSNDYPNNTDLKKVQEKKELPKKHAIKKQKKPKVKTVTKKIIPKQIKIQIQNTENDIRDIIKRFKKNNNPALSLFVAKKEYELANYNQAYNYALITNKLNNNIEESWLIFAKSLVKLGQKKKAIYTLKEYIRYSHSNNAKILLNEILSGKFI